MNDKRNYFFAVGLARFGCKFYLDWSRRFFNPELVKRSQPSGPKMLNETVVRDYLKKV